MTHRLVIGAITAVLVAGLPTATSTMPASAWTQGPSSAAPAGADPLEPPIYVTFTATLNYDRSRLRRKARKVSTPGTRSYRSFATLSQAASRFGAGSSTRRQLRNRVRTLGLEIDFAPTGLTARIRGKASTWEDIYDRSLSRSTSNGWEHWFMADPSGAIDFTVPDDIADVVAALIPTDSRPSFSTPSPLPQAQVPGPLLTGEGSTPPINTGSPFGPGVDCLPQDMPRHVYSPHQLIAAYGTSALHDRGIRGEGTRIAEVLEGFSYTPGALQESAACLGYQSVDVRDVPGPGVPARMTHGWADLEGDLDLQMIAPVIPEASSIAFVEVAESNSAYLSLINLTTTAFSAVDPMPDVLTHSNGWCELELLSEDTVRPYTDDHFALAAILGISILSSSGDTGSSNCMNAASLPPAERRQRAAHYPASSPWVTGIGGTRIILGPGNRRVDEVTWNDLAWKVLTAGSGAPSLYARPWYQRSVTQRDRRLVPDMSAHSSNYPGFVVRTAQGGSTADWEILGGTSGATPFLASNIALINAREREKGLPPLGFLNPWLYSLADSEVYRDAFFDITQGDNQLFTETACCAAGRGYDTATGLGAPRLDVLVDLVMKPGARRTRAPISLP